MTGSDAGQIAMATVLGGGIGAIGGLVEPGVGTSAGIGAAAGVVGALATGGGYGSMALSGLAGAASGAVGAMAPGTSGIVVGALTGFAGGMAAAGPGAEIDKRLNRSSQQPCPSSRYLYPLLKVGEISSCDVLAARLHSDVASALKATFCGITIAFFANLTRLRIRRLLSAVTTVTSLRNNAAV